LDFDPRWTDDPRDRADRDRELSRGSRGGLSNPRECERLDIRDVFTRDLELPRGPERERVWARDSDVRLRGSEVRALATVGAFRVVPAGDLRDGQDRPLEPNRGYLRHLRQQGLVETIPTIGEDRALVVLTEHGRDVLERNRWSNVQRAVASPHRLTHHAGNSVDRSTSPFPVSLKALTHVRTIFRVGEDKANMLRSAPVALRTCTVSFSGPSGICHSVDVTAESVYEAAALGREPPTCHRITVH